MILAIKAVFPMEKLWRLTRSLRLLFHVKFLFFARRRLQGLTDNVLPSYVDCFCLKQNVCLFLIAFFAIPSPFELFCALGDLVSTSNHIPPRLASHRLFRFSNYLAYVFFFFRSLSGMVMMFVSSCVVPLPFYLVLGRFGDGNTSTFCLDLVEYELSVSHL